MPPCLPCICPPCICLASLRVVTDIAPITMITSFDQDGR